MARFKILYTPYDETEYGTGYFDTAHSTEVEVDVRGWDTTNWKDDDFYDEGLEPAVRKQHPHLDLMNGEIEDWWPVKGNETFSHLSEEQ